MEISGFNVSGNILTHKTEFTTFFAELIAHLTAGTLLCVKNEEQERHSTALAFKLYFHRIY